MTKKNAPSTAQYGVSRKENFSLKKTNRASKYDMLYSWRNEKKERERERKNFQFPSCQVDRGKKKEFQVSNQRRRKRIVWLVVVCMVLY